jgi:hypothetical protein
MGTKVSEIGTKRGYPEASRGVILRDSRELRDREIYAGGSRISCASVCIVSPTDVDIKCSMEDKKHISERDNPRISRSEARAKGRALLASMILCENIRRQSDHRNHQELY